MEYVRNGTLLDHLEKGRGLPLPLVRNFGAQLVNFLEYIHAGLEVCHRDLKPGNIMLDENLYLKIVSTLVNFKPPNKLSNCAFQFRLISVMQKHYTTAKIMELRSILKLSRLKTFKSPSGEILSLELHSTLHPKCLSELSQGHLQTYGRLE